uniref:DET1 homolog n=1 Tax=Syphacia muris TaxID=451379 RepID=A0A0N5AFU5_9BILA
MYGPVDVTEVKKFSREWCRRKRYPDIHLVKMLCRRELGVRKSGTQFFYGGREFYQCIYPGEKIQNIIINLWVKRFSPNGKYLVCFNCDCHTISVRDYVGYSAVAITSTSSLFEAVFPERFSLDLCLVSHEMAMLNNDCVFFTQDSKFLIVATEAQVPESIQTISQIYRNNESLQPLSSQLLNTICFYCIDLENGTVCDTFTLSVDRIWVARGVHLVERVMAIFSLQQQTVHILRINQNGRFTKLKELGRTLYDDDSIILSKYNHAFGSETFLTGMKQRLLTFLFHKAKRENTVDDFLRDFGYLRDLRIWQMQIVLPDVLLLRFVKQDAFSSSANINSQPAIFVFINWRSAEILAVFDKYTDQFLWIVENFYEQFKNPQVLDNRFPMTMQHCYFDYERHCRLKLQSLAKDGMRLRIQRQILSHLPYCTTFAPINSPYLDLAMFKYDDSLPSSIERMRSQQREQLRFFSRVTSQPLFDIELSGEKLEQLLFHPFEPFAFSFDRTVVGGTGTFHIPSSALKTS